MDKITASSIATILEATDMENAKELTFALELIKSALATRDLAKSAK